MVTILSEDMRKIANKIDDYLNLIKETENSIKTSDKNANNDISLDSMLTTQASPEKVASSINVQKLTQLLDFPLDKIEIFKSALAALQKSPPELDTQQAAALIMGFQKVSKLNHINEDFSTICQESYNPQFSDKIQYDQIHSALIDAIEFAPVSREIGLKLLRQLVFILQTHKTNDDINALFNATFYLIKFGMAGDRDKFLTLFHDLDSRFEYSNTVSKQEYTNISRMLDTFGKEIWSQTVRNKDKVSA